MKRARCVPPQNVPPQSRAARAKIAAIVRLLERKRGVTAAEVLGWADASVRAVVSRLEQQGAEITRRQERGRGTVYTLIERFTGRKDRTRLTKAQAAKLGRQGGLLPKLRGLTHAHLPLLRVQRTAHKRRPAVRGRLSPRTAGA
jgi:biotin operon repressor